MAELDAMTGLTSVKEQVRSIAASIEAARRRTIAGIATERPMRHFVFLGPPGTGKTSSARALAKIFYAFGLLATPEMTEAHGEAVIRTDELIDSALGGMLFIDEAYKLRPQAVQTLLKRAEENRDILIIILAGSEKQMEAFLASNPRFAFRFASWLKFGSYSPPEMMAMAERALECREGDVLDPVARVALWNVFCDIDRRQMIDELGNGRFVHILLEKSAQARDMRVITGQAGSSLEDLVTIRGGDVNRAYAELL
jgi:SpoVK/Ycf46/Vps4 family AAA+-type ATPase